MEHIFNNPFKITETFLYYPMGAINEKHTTKMEKPAIKSVYELIDTDIDIIIQARMGSSRLPGKVMKYLQDKIVLDHVVERVSKSKRIRNVIICTSIKPQDDAIYNHCLDNNILCFRGSELNVLERYYEAALYYKSAHIVRVCCDCPLIDSYYIDAMIDVYLEKQLNYLGPKYYGNHKFPDGFNCEVFNFKILEEANKYAMDSEKEHVTTYIIKKYSKFQFEYKLNKNYVNVDLNHLHLSLDTMEDYQGLKDIFKNVYTKNHDFTLDDVLEFLNNKK